jgi:hypothetical protein
MKSYHAPLSQQKKQISSLTHSLPLSERHLNASKNGVGGFFLSFANMNKSNSFIHVLSILGRNKQLQSSLLPAMGKLVD